ncbi:MAG: hypothetical protein NC328_00555 [Muribaculum sp.]|nr:hypothetical protein [Muribaculum sp.]
MKSISRYLHIACTLLFVGILQGYSPLQAKADGISGTWRVHQGFDMAYNRVGAHVVSSFGTPFGAYLLVRGRAFAPQDKHVVYRDEVNHVFKYDRSAPQKGLYPLVDELELSGSSVQAAGYSPAARRLVAVYEDGAMDIISDGGDVVSPAALKNCFSGEANKAMSVTFDPDGTTFYVSTATGFMAFDIISGECTEICNIGRSINSINRVGSHYVVLAAPAVEEGLDPVFSSPYAISNSYYADLYVFDSIDDIKIDKDAYTRVSLCGNATLPSALTGHYDKEARRLMNVQCVYPLTESTFLAVPMKENNNFGLFAVHINQGGDCEGAFVSHGTYDRDRMGVAWYMTSRHFLEGNTGEWRDGVMATYANSIALIRKGVDLNVEEPEGVDKFIEQAVSETGRGISDLPGAAADENYAPTCTYDGHTFHTYIRRQGLLTRTLNAGENTSSPVWSAPSDMVEVNASGSSDAYYLAYHPKYGMLVRGTPFIYGTYGNNANYYDNISAYRDGKWTQLGHVFNNQPALASGISQVRGLAVDPENPDWIYGSTFYHGVTRMNTADPTDFLIMTWTGDSYLKNQNYPGAVGCLEAEPKWNGVCSFSEPTFDNNGTLWMQRVSMNMGNLPLYYWTKEDRLASADIAKDHTHSETYGPKKLVGEEVTPHHPGRALALRRPGNENIIAFVAGASISNSYCPYFYDHNGTLDDPSDDRYRAFKDIYIDNHGTKGRYNGSLTGVYETMEGDVWFLGMSGILTVNPREAFEQEINKVTLLNIEEGNGSVEAFGQNPVRCMAEDSFGNKWVGGVYGGVYCISKDNKRMLAHFTTENSLLPSNDIYGICLNEATGSVWIGTQNGIAEFIPAGMGEVSSAEHIRAIPASVTPDYRGNVTFYGLRDSADYIIADAEGNELCRLPRANEGAIAWPVCDTQLTTGTYTLREAISGNTLLSIDILR